MEYASHSYIYMTHALCLAKKASQKNEVPVGALIVERQSQKILGMGYNQTRAQHDPTAHAEILAIRTALHTLEQERFWEDVDLYVTLEPCPMCAQAISFARVSRVYFGAYDPKGGGVEHGPRIFNQPSCFSVPEVFGGIAESKCQHLLLDFFRARRGI